ncbi:hypothetical protein PBI_SCTP2_473 [Salicola phage SCTP-2]|nr:hypothetical protein PBI_SCTP2_473 [Salicola phage SCTP-2]
MSNNSTPVDIKSYLDESSRTAVKLESLEFDEYTYKRLHYIMNEFVRLGNELDCIKKHLFYGKEYPDSMIDGYSDSLENNNYASFDSFGVDLVHGLIGKATEAVEGIEILQGYINHPDEPIDVINLEEEIGDGFWYDAMLLRLINSDFESAADKNISKLKIRFPDKFDSEKAINRDTIKERQPWNS